MYEVGDKVRVTRLVNDFDDRCLKLGSVHTVLGIRKGDEAVFIRVAGDNNYVMLKSQIEKVEESKEMTFPEMVQKLINGEFEVGTELMMFDVDGWELLYQVTKDKYGYSIVNKNLTTCSLTSSKMNGVWVIHEAVKEMSIEELQKELGYKIKIVE